MTLKSDGADYRGFIRINNTIVENCTLNGKTAYWGYTTATFTGCTFSAPEGDYALWDYSTPSMTFDGCTFNISGKGVNVYVEAGNAGSATRTVTVKNCTVDSSRENKAFLNIKNSTQSYDVTFSGTNTVKGLGANGTTGSNLYQVETTEVTETSGKPVTVKQEANGTLTTVYEVKTAAQSTAVAKTADGQEYATLEAALAAVTKDNALTEVTEKAWPSATPVYYNGEFYTTISEVLYDGTKNSGVITANVESAAIYCRPGAKISNGGSSHSGFVTDTTIYGNGATLTGATEWDVENYFTLTKNITINIYSLNGGASVWSTRKSDFTVTVNMEDCQDAHEVLFNYGSGNGRVIANVKNCTFLKSGGAAHGWPVSINCLGSLTVDGCTFDGVITGVVVNVKQPSENGEMRVSVTNSTFNNVTGQDDNKGALRVTGQKECKIDLTIGNVQFTGTHAVPEDITLGNAKSEDNLGEITYTIFNTSGSLATHKVGETTATTETLDGTTVMGTNAATAVGDGTKEHPYTLEQLGAMTRDEYIEAQQRLNGTMYVTVGDYRYDKDGVLGNGERNDTPGQTPDHSKLNAYGENGYLGEKNDGANGKNIVFVGNSITSGATGYTSIDKIGTSLLLAVPAYTNVTFEGITFNNVMSFDYQLYTSPWSQLGELKFDGCTFNGIIVGAIAAQTLNFNGCTFNNYSNTTDANSSNPTWIRPAYGNWTKGDNEGQGEGFRSLTKINFTDNTVTSTRPVKFEYISQWDITSTVTATGNYFDISAQNGDEQIKNVGLYLGAYKDENEFHLVVDKNTKSDKTAALYTIPEGKTSLPVGSTVTDTAGNPVELTDALKWKAADAVTDKITLKTVTAAPSGVAAIGSTGYPTLAAALDAAQDGATVTLLADVTEDVTINKSITLDLNGKTLTNTNAGAATISVTGGTVTVKNGTVTGGASYYNIEVTKGSNANLTLENVTATAGNDGSSMIDNYGDLTINSGSYTRGLNTIKNEPNAKLTINGGTFTLEKGTSKGFSGVVFNYGELNISGGEFIQSDKSALYGQAQVIHTDKSGSSAPSTIITGGSFTNKCTKSTAWPVRETNAAAGCTKVSGGTFNKELQTSYIADGSYLTKNSDGTYGIAEGECEAMIEKVGYPTLEEALGAVTAGDTVKLVKDVTVEERLVIGKRTTLDLGGYILTSTYAMGSASGEARYALMNKWALTIQNGTFAADEARAIGAYNKLTLDSVIVTQKLTDGNACVAFCKDKQIYTIKNSTIDGAYAVCNFANNATVNISDSTLEGTGNTLYHNGSNYGLKLTVKNTKITSSGSCGVYISGSTSAQANAVNQNGAGGYQKASFTGCTISGAMNGIEVKYTDLTLDGCTVKTTAAKSSYTQDNNGPAASGFAVVSTDNAMNGATPKPEGTIIIKGNGSYTGLVGLGALESVKTNYEGFKDETIKISGGTFSSKVLPEYCATGFVPTENADGTFGVEVDTSVAEVNGAKKYDTLQEAVNAAPRNATVKLLRDTKENVTISTNNVTLDLNGFTLNGGTEKGKPALTVNNTRVTVQDNSVEQTGTIKREDTAENSGVSSHYVIDVQGKNGFLKFEGGNVRNNSGNADGSKGASLVRVGDDKNKVLPTMTIIGGTFTQDNFIVLKVDYGTLYVKGGTVSSKTSYAVENWRYADIKENAVVNGAVSSWTYSGGADSALTISGGTVNGNVEAVSYDGAEGKLAKVAITGGTVNGTLSTKCYIGTTEPTKDMATIKVTGGTFNNDPSAYLVEGSTVTKNGDGTFGVEKAYLAQVGETSYYTMDEAFKAQTTSREPIVLLRDYTTGSTFNSGTVARVVDLNKHTWTCTGTDANSAAFEINNPNASLTVKNGKIVSSQLVGLIPSAMGGTIKYDNSSLVFDGVEMTTTATSGIETNGNNTNDNVTLKNSTLNVPNGFGIYFPSSGKLTIENSTINAKTMGVQVCAGSLSINAGSTITVSGGPVEKTEKDGAIQDGAAISIVNRTGYKGLGDITVTGGTFTAKSGNAAIKAYNWDNENKKEDTFTESDKVSVSGGTFSSEVKPEYCAIGFEPKTNGDGTYGVRAAEGNAYYTNGDGKVVYGDLSALLTDSETEGKTITLLTNVTSAKSIALWDDRTIDLAGLVLEFTGNAKFMTMDGWIKDSTNGNGVLKIAQTYGEGKQTTAIQSSNEQLPIYDSAKGGYRLFDCKMVSMKKAEGDGVVIWLCPQFKNLEAYKLLKSGNAHNTAVSVIVSWNTTSGEKVSRSFEFTQAMMDTVVNNYNFEANHPGQLFKLTLTGLGSDLTGVITNVAAQPCMGSKTGALKVGEMISLAN